MVDITDTDSGVGVDGAAFIKDSTDTGSGADTVFLLLVGIQQGVGTEPTNVAFTATESAIGANLGGLIATILGTETGVGGEIVNEVRALDSGIGSDLSTLVHRAFESGHGSDVFEFASVPGTLTVTLTRLGTVELSD